MTDQSRHPRGMEQPYTLLASVWPTGTDSIATQLAGRGYHDATDTDLSVMPPAIAEYAITALTRPGDVVLDPDCGAGTTVVEALRAGRHAIGLTTHRRWWRLARANVTAAKAAGAPMDGMVLILDRRPGTLAVAETAGLTGRVDLLLTTLRPPTGDDPAESGGRLRALLSECRSLVRPGGHVVITIPPRRHPVRHTMLDLPSELLALGAAAGLAPVARCVALTADLRGARVRTRATLAEWRTATHMERLIGHPIALRAHHDVLVVRADPDALETAPAMPVPTVPTRPRRRRTRAGRELAVASIAGPDAEISACRSAA
ncbi:DNA methyltransferase [Amycolatopsis sp. NPDC059657]|uniref:DNA methyltransferase n=1 Tax=Amycolatopsis sp. NPDC059657 TaxID=3346899 RepID=UPI0036710C89